MINLTKKVTIFLILVLIILSSVFYKFYVDKNEKDIDNKSNTTTQTEISEDKPKRIASLDFKLKDLNDKEITLSEFKGKKVMLNFWATWCGYCVQEMPYMQNIHNETKDKDIVILAVNVGENKDKIKKFMEKKSYDFPVVLDERQEVAQNYGVQAFPTTLFIDEEGFVYSGIQGPMTDDIMRKELKIK
ncbi:TlpA family protein disulfide reductase [Clostridium tetani]|uniref:TlpA family protein disulfide reductase n=1 Tax=Clostridium tetani TaxID=1513 RepID=A0A4Q0VB22_CLOTA|nr:TlpA family protein disulfide reductase [Clostridium tetani]RXI74221.1 TlpA family protein disulfide reductase [Clostridium tetani]